MTARTLRIWAALLITFAIANLAVVAGLAWVHALYGPLDGKWQPVAALHTMLGIAPLITSAGLIGEAGHKDKYGDTQ